VLDVPKVVQLLDANSLEELRSSKSQGILYLQYPKIDYKKLMLQNEK
jgi:hypothetical protein